MDILYAGSLDISARMPWESIPGVRVHRVDAQENVALWEEDTEIDLHIYEPPSATSHYRHHLDRMTEWRDGPQLQYVKTVKVKAVKGDDWLKAKGIEIDFAYLNIEGSELAALKGLSESIKNAVACEVEVTFTPDYFIGAPVFADVDEHLRDVGMSFYKFTALHTVNIEGWPKHEFQGKALYIRKGIKEDKLALLMKAYS